MKYILAALWLATALYSQIIEPAPATNGPAVPFVEPPPAYHPTNTATLNRPASTNVPPVASTLAPPRVPTFPVAVVDMAVLQLPNGQRLFCVKDTQLGELAKRWPAVVVTNTVIMSDGALKLPQEF